METEFKTTHDLPFEVAEWGLSSHFMRFRVGTCNGLWICTEASYEILVVENDEPGNGDFEDVLEWFEHSCKRDSKTLKILEVWNERFAQHLMLKRGFTHVENDDYLKTFE